MHLHQALQRIAKQHQSEPADHRVEARGFDFQVFAVGDLKLHVRQASALRVVFGQGEDGRRQVGGQHAAAGADAARDHQRLFASAGGNVEHPRAGADAGHAEHALGGPRKPGADQRTVRVPAWGRAVPLGAGGVFRVVGHGARSR